MPAPLIGITLTRSINSYGYPVFTLAEAYVQALVQAGARPVLIPNGLPEDDLKDLFNRLDGILLSGGGDVDPDRYGSSPHPLVSEIDRDRDRIEVELTEAALQSGKPFLGICRGLQVINVALGGSLYEDLLDQRPHSAQHQFFPQKPRQYLAHEVVIANPSHLAELVNSERLQVNSFHHQGIQRLAPGLHPSAMAPDGLVEAVELPDFPFGLAVQWHPEWLTDRPETQVLFRAFIQAAQG